MDHCPTSSVKPSHMTALLRLRNVTRWRHEPARPLVCLRVRALAQTAAVKRSASHGSRWAQYPYRSDVEQKLNAVAFSRWSQSVERATQAGLPVRCGVNLRLALLERLQLRVKLCLLPLQVL